MSYVDEFGLTHQTMAERLNPLPVIGLDVQFRFWSKVLDHSDPSACWIWVGNRSVGGYGALGINRKMYKAHRISYKLHYGDFPVEMLVCHECNDPRCVNPKHLYLGTQSENVQQCILDGRRGNIGLNHSHILSEENVREIRRLLDASEDCVKISKRFGVCSSTIRAIKYEINWRCVTD